MISLFCLILFFIKVQRLLYLIVPALQVKEMMDLILEIAVIDWFNSNLIQKWWT